jgi:hypothetical protein
LDIARVRTFADFEIIETIDNSCPYPPLLGIVDLKKRHMTFEKDGLRVIAPLDPDEGQRYTEPIGEED